jgi:hypothetical protein
MAAMKSFELVFLEIMVVKISTKLFRFNMTSLADGSQSKCNYSN